MRRRQQEQISRLRESERFKDGIGKKRKRSAKMANEYENLDFLTMNMDNKEKHNFSHQPQKFQKTGFVLEWGGRRWCKNLPYFVNTIFREINFTKFSWNWYFEASAARACDVVIVKKIAARALNVHAQQLKIIIIVHKYW